jgi:microcystin-dependent protein
MPTFKTGSGVGDTYATILLTFPAVDWFKWAIIGAVNLMTEDENWFEEGDVGISFAVEECKKMLEALTVMDFNPFPPGMVFPFGSDTAPPGYLLCDGATYAAVDYPELFSVIGYNFGGSGADFNVPSLYNRVVVGGGDIYATGDTGGEAEVFLDVASMPSHSHSDAGHTHSIPLVVGLPAQAGVGFSANQTVPVVTASTGIGFANITSTGGDGGHNNLQPYQAIPYIIYAGR